MSALSTRLELTVPADARGSIASLLRSRTNAEVTDVNGTLCCDLPTYPPDLPDAVGGWLAGMRIEGASVRTGSVDALAPGWPRSRVTLGSWLGVNTTDASHVRLEYDGGLCFGSGFHPSTAACADVLAAIVQTDLSGSRVVEIGCGAGLFSVALAKLGATVVAIDTWEEAVRQTARNAETNGVGTRVDARCIDARDFDVPSADIIVANLAPCVALGPRLAPRAAKFVALSGLQHSQVEQVLQGYAPLRERAREGNSHWVGLLLERVGAP